MRSNDKIYSFFIALAFIFWNPISYFLVYGRTSVFSVEENRIFYLIHSVIFISGILVICRILKGVFSKKTKNMIFAAAFTGILFSVLVGLDSLVGLVSKNEVAHVQKQEGLMFEPDSKARYQTTEFDYMANINSLGLRDREIRIEKEGKFRILCFGDSYTFGWGVNIENSWPKKLEQYLIANGPENVEVINCGKPGGCTSTYKKYMRKVVPLLKPDLVLVGVLQADDLRQLYEKNVRSKQADEDIVSQENFTGKLKSVIGRYLKHSFKNILSLLYNRGSKTIKIRSNWKITCKKMIENFNHMQKVHFSTFDYTVQTMFKSGDLNPSLLNFYMSFPGEFNVFNNPNHPATKFAIQEMDKDFKEMAHICEKYNSQLVFMNLPINVFTGHIVVRTPSDVLNSYYETNNNIDPIYRSIANTNDLPYIELTDYFIDLQDKSGYFFMYDGHPNEKGYEEIAKYIGGQLIEQDILIKE